MASTPSIVASLSPKHTLPADFSIMEEAKHAQPHAQAKASTASASPSVFQKIVAELVGTYILIFAGCGAALTDREKSLTIVGIALVWGLVLMAVIYSLGHVSGAHFNPAVTISLAAGCKFPLIHVPIYVLTQLMGSTLACLTLRQLFNDQDSIHPTMTQYASPTTDFQAITWEFIITFALVFTICGVATDDRADKAISGLAIGGTAMFNVIIAGPITGASMNPARSIGPAVVSGVYKNLWVFVVAPILGGLAATLIYGILRKSKPEKCAESVEGTNNDLHLHSEV